VYVQNSLITLLHTSINDHIATALAYQNRRGMCEWCGHPGQQSAMGGKINILMKKIEFLHSTNFKLRQIIGNSINNGDILEICNLRQQWPLLLLAPGVKKT
jgi:hypothetical protein